MFTCSKCKTDWPENYCPRCAQTIDRSRTESPPPREASTAPPKSKAPQSAAKAATTFTTAEKIAGLTRCLRWFVGLFVLNLLTFWAALLLLGDSSRAENWAEIVFLVGLATVGPLAVYVLYRFSRLTGSYKPMIFFSLFVLLPPLATFTLILLAGKTLAESKKLGYQITVLPPRLSAGLVSGFLLLVGCWQIYDQSVLLRNHAWLKKSGMPTSGTLEMVTRHTVDFIPVGYTFTISYLGKSKTFDVDSEVLRANTLLDGRFTHHPIALVDIPDRPDVADLPEMLGFRVTSLLPILFGGIVALFGGAMLYLVIKVRF